MKVHFTALLALLTAPVLAQDFLVLFKQAEISIGSLDHEAYTQVLQGSNQKSITDLNNWLQRQGTRSDKAMKNLWLIRGATLSVSHETIKKLVKEPWIQGVHEDRFRKMVPPRTNSKTVNSIQELGEGELWGLGKIGIPQLREEFPQIQGQGVSIGVLDTGIQSRHPELVGRVTHFKDFINGLENDYDDHGHGTHVSGTIAGTEVGIAPQSKILMAKIFGATGGGQDSVIIEAMQWQFDPDGNPQTADYPRVISNSWGADIEEGIHDIREFEPYQLAIQTWINGGIIPVFAAGNSGKAPNGIPGGLPEVISVGAIDSNGEVAEFSSVGPNLWKIGELILTLMKPDISAPGVAIPSALPGNKYGAWDGTSMATPHLSGSIALLLQANPKLTYSEVKTLLFQTAEKKVDNKFGYGILNTYELVKAGLNQKKK